MPAQVHDTAKQLAGIQAAMGQHDDGPARWDGRPQLAQHPQPVAPPGVLEVGGQDRPGHRDGTTPIDHTDGQDREARAQGRVCGKTWWSSLSVWGSWRPPGWSKEGCLATIFIPLILKTYPSELFTSPSQPHRGEGGEGGLESSDWQAFLRPFPYVGISVRHRECA
jgi:hypothetical protein